MRINYIYVQSDAQKTIHLIVEDVTKDRQLMYIICDVGKCSWNSRDLKLEISVIKQTNMQIIKAHIHFNCFDKVLALKERRKKHSVFLL